MSGETQGWHSPGRDMVAMNHLSAQSPLCFCNPCQGAVRHERPGSLLFACNSKMLQEVNFLLSWLKLSVTDCLGEAQGSFNIWHPYCARFLLRTWLYGKGVHSKILIQTCCWREQHPYCWVVLHWSLIPSWMLQFTCRNEEVCTVAGLEQRDCIRKCTRIYSNQATFRNTEPFPFKNWISSWTAK